MRNITSFEEFEAKINLDNINFLISKKEEGLKWTITKTKRIEKYYKQFLFLSYKFPDKVLVPTKEVDEYWHHHIMDTEKYYLDCKKVFGEVLHHYPYLGTKNKKDKLLLQNLFIDTLNLYRQNFDISPSRLNKDFSACGSGGGKCGGGGGGGRCGGRRSQSTLSEKIKQLTN